MTFLLCLLIAQNPQRPILAKPPRPLVGQAAAQVPSALAEVNAARARRGLRPYLYDAGLTLAAERCAQARAAGLVRGHLPNDFAYLPPGVRAASAGCGALEPSWGWGTCCTFDAYTYAGAAVAVGRDGRRYMHLFVR